MTRTPIVPTWGQGWTPAEYPDHLDYSNYPSYWWSPDPVTHSYIESIFDLTGPMLIGELDVVYDDSVAISNPDSGAVMTIDTRGFCETPDEVRSRALHKLAWHSDRTPTRGPMGVAHRWENGQEVRHLAVLTGRGMWFAPALGRAVLVGANRKLDDLDDGGGIDLGVTTDDLRQLMPFVGWIQFSRFASLCSRGPSFPERAEDAVDEMYTQVRSVIARGTLAEPWVSAISGQGLDGSRGIAFTDAAFTGWTLRTSKNSLRPQVHQACARAFEQFPSRPNLDNAAEAVRAGLQNLDTTNSEQHKLAQAIAYWARQADVREFARVYRDHLGAVSTGSWRR